MQSSGSRSPSPNPEQDTLLQPRSSTTGEIVDVMPVKKAGNERGTTDTIGLGLVLVGRILRRVKF